MNSNMERIISLVSEKLGISEEKLKTSLEKGKIEDMLSDMKKEDAAKLQTIMNNPAAKEKLLNSSEAEKFIKKMKE